MNRRDFIKLIGAAGAAFAAGSMWKEDAKFLPNAHVKEDLADMVTNMDPSEVPLLRVVKVYDPEFGVFPFTMDRWTPSPFGVNDSFARRAARAFRRWR